MTMPPDLLLLDAVKAFCDAPANPQLVERMGVARGDVRLDEWLRRWPHARRDMAERAWENMRRALGQNDGELRRDEAAVLKTQIERLMLATRKRMSAPTRKPSAKPKAEDLPLQWWQKY